MTEKGRFKKQVRARMARTGETYMAARAHLLSRPPTRPTTRRGGRGMYPFERFTEKAKNVLALAQEEAQRAHHNYIGTEHVLIGLLRVQDGLAARVLGELGIELEAVRQTIESVLGRTAFAGVRQIHPTSRVKSVIEIAFREAMRMGHQYVGTEHLLLGILEEGNGIAAHALDQLGAPLAKVRPAIEKHVQGASEGPLSFDEETMVVLRRARDLALKAGTESIGLAQLRAALRGRKAS